jgi:hypothetical protein
MDPHKSTPIKGRQNGQAKEKLAAIQGQGKVCALIHFIPQHLTWSPFGSEFTSL